MENPRGSKPASPGTEPSSLGGLSKNGTEGLASIENRALETVAVREDSWTPEKDDGRCTAAPPRADTKANIVTESEKVYGKQRLQLEKQVSKESLRGLEKLILYLEQDGEEETKMHQKN